MNDFHGWCDSKENINTTLTLYVLLVARPCVRVECPCMCACVYVRVCHCIYLCVLVSGSWC